MGRYHLYVSYACPEAHRTLMVLTLKGLQHVVSFSVVHPTFQRTRTGLNKDDHVGWVFKDPKHPPLHSALGHGSIDCEGCIPDPIYGSASIIDLYARCNDTSGKYTVPILWDKKTETIVNNDSKDISIMFANAFNKFARHPEVDLYPPSLSGAIEVLDSWIGPSINDGVYRCGFATQQIVFDTASNALFASLERMDALLGQRRYLCGPQFTLADIFLFVTLFRFDEIYYVYFKTNRKLLREFPNLINFTREIYQMPGVSEVSNMDHCKKHYYTSHPQLNTFAILPMGCDSIKIFSMPHNRSSVPNYYSLRPYPTFSSLIPSHAYGVPNYSQTFSQTFSALSSQLANPAASSALSLSNHPTLVNTPISRLNTPYSSNVLSQLKRKSSHLSTFLPFTPRLTTCSSLARGTEEGISSI